MMEESVVRELVIIGASGFGREVAWLVERINAIESSWNILGFIDDDTGKHENTVDGYDVLGGIDAAARFPNAWFICAIGGAKSRKRVIEKLKSITGNIRFATLIDPSVIHSKRLTVGEGSIICAATIITVNVEIGSHVIINLDCTIGHDAVIADYVTMYPSVNISGAAVISECVEIGTGTQIIQGKKIGAESVIGAGAAVIRDIPAKCTAVGCPAIPIKFFEGNEVEK